MQRGELEAARRAVALADREHPLVRGAVALAPAIRNEQLVDPLAHDLVLGVAEERLGLRGPRGHVHVLVDRDVGVMRGLEHGPHERGAVARPLERQRMVERDRRGARHARQHIEVGEGRLADLRQRDDAEGPLAAEQREVELVADGDVLAERGDPQPGIAVRDRDRAALGGRAGRQPGARFEALGQALALEPGDLRQRGAACRLDGVDHVERTDVRAGSCAQHAEHVRRQAVELGLGRERADDGVERLDALLLVLELGDRARELVALRLELGVVVLEVLAIAPQGLGHGVERRAERADLGRAVFGDAAVEVALLHAPRGSRHPPDRLDDALCERDRQQDHEQADEQHPAHDQRDCAIRDRIHSRGLAVPLGSLACLQRPDLTAQRVDPGLATGAGDEAGGRGAVHPRAPHHTARPGPILLDVRNDRAGGGRLARLGRAGGDELPLGGGNRPLGGVVGLQEAGVVGDDVAPHPGLQVQHQPEQVLAGDDLVVRPTHVEDGVAQRAHRVEHQAERAGAQQQHDRADDEQPPGEPPCHGISVASWCTGLHRSGSGRPSLGDREYLPAGGRCVAGRGLPFGS